MQEFAKKVGKNVQPYILCVRGQDADSYFVQGDGIIISIPDRIEPIVAFDLLYKCFYVLNVAFPDNLINFYNFFDCYLYKISKNAPSVVTSIHINVLNINIEDEGSANDDHN